MPMRQRQPYPLHLHLSFAIVGLIVFSCLVLGGYQYSQSTQRMLQDANATFESVGRAAAAAITNELKPARTIVALMSRSSITTSNSIQARRERLPQLAAALRQNEHISAVYLGTQEGSFMLLRRLSTPALQERFGAPPEAAYVAQSVNRDDVPAGGPADGRYFFYNAALDQIEAREMPDYQFDPRTRPWYTAASEASSADEVVQTGPYVFFSTREVGLSVAARHPFSVVVAGVDVTLSALSDVLAQQRMTPSSELVIFDHKGMAIAYAQPGKLIKGTGATAVTLSSVEELGVPVLSALWHKWGTVLVQASKTADKTVDPANDKAADWAEKGVLRVDGKEWLTRVEQLSGTGQHQLYLAVAAPREELLAEAQRVRLQSVLISIAVVLMMLPLAWWFARNISKPLRRLADQAQAIQRFKFDTQEMPSSLIEEVHELAHAMDGMKHTVQRFLEISGALSAEGQFQKLLDLILTETISSVKGAAGVILLANQAGTALEVTSSRLVSDPSAPPIDMPSRSIQDANSLVAQAARSGKTLTRDARRDNPNDAQWFGGTFDWLGSAHFSQIAVPLRNRKQELIGVLALYFDEDSKASATSLAPERIAFIEALSGTAAVAIDNQQLLLGQKQLLESFIQLMAGAIDAKSPYTGGHCQRVPDLTKMLAEAACAQTTGPFADYHLSEEQWEELHIASWLHDCGKVTTPEFVVDKATKLETIYDRIHEIRMRFEVLKRDAEIELYQRALQAAGHDVLPLRAELAERVAMLDDEFHFIAACNEGGEFMAPDKVERLKQIATRQWQRTLDDSVGVSRDERVRKGYADDAVSTATLPVTEFLLADKPEHIFKRPERENLVPDNAWGFKLKVPVHLYNRGEVYNLSIGRGTLTDEERYKINEHIVQTIRMLEQLPFPKHLKGVPEIAGGHHEKMDGTGYPRRLKQGEMSVSARMMAIADIFEALTAEDRPYKKGKKLSEALKIMFFMKNDQHIDPDLFELFLRSGIYLQYAQQFMNPEQIDAVDISGYLNP